VTAARQIYAGIRNAVSGAQYHDGLPPGSELGGWNFGIAPLSATNVPFAQIFQTVFGKSWTWDQFDWSSDLSTMDAALGPMVNATSTDLRAFQAAGGKIVLFQGLADGVQPYTMSQKYWDGVERSMPGEPAKFARLFNAPSMTHCSGGDGPNVFGNILENPFAGDPTRDLLSAVEAWVEKGTAPDSMLATKFTGNDVTKTVQMVRPLCAYPKVLKYSGSGDPNLAASFACALP
jgi:feruloyl esterase